MNNLEINRSPSYPYYPSVKFNAETGVCDIEGESYMEEAYKFYLPLINWLKSFIREKGQKIELNVKLIYFNTSTTKCLLDMFEILRQYKEVENGEIEITWFYDKDDPDMIDEVKDFEKEADLSINIKEF
ncbi:MAG: DUF1987 domain-containing protein [Bacteroidota bacterium]